MTFFQPSDIEKMKLEGDLKGLTATLENIDLKIRKKAIDAMGEMGERAIEVLIKALRNDSKVVREMAIERLVGMSEHSVEPLIDGLSYTEKEVLERTTREELFELKWPCIEPLVRIGLASVDPLIKTMQLDEDFNKRNGAALALGAIGDRRAFQPLLDSLENGRCIYASHALGVMGDSAAVEPLLKLLERGAPSSSEYQFNPEAKQKYELKIIHALGMIGDKRAVQPLSYILFHTSFKFQDGYRKCLAAFAALRSINDISTFEPFVQVLTNRMFLASLRFSAAARLGELGDPRAIQPLISVLDDDKKLFGVTELKNEYMCVKAAEVLGSMRSLEAVEPLLKLLSHKKKEIRAGVAEALGRIGDRRAEEPLQQTLSDKKALVKEAAQKALEQIRGVKQSFVGSEK